MTPRALLGACRRHRARRLRPARRSFSDLPLAATITAVLAIALLPLHVLAGPTDEEPPEGPQPITPVLGLAPTQLDFVGCIAIGSCVEKTFDLFNDVDDPESMLEITDILVAGAGYSISNGPTPPVFIPGDGTRVTYTVRFCPENGEHTPGGITILARVAHNSPQHLALSGDANLPPSCDAGGPYMGSQGLPLVFDGSESEDPDIGGRIDTYHWDFGDGTTGLGVRPNHIYSVPGPYPITLTVTDNCAAASACSTVAIIQLGNLLPICDAGGPYSSVVGVPIQFDGRGSSDPDGIITAYFWQFGDGHTATGPIPSHIYAAANVYTVTLRVTDDRQASSVCTDLVTITGNSPPNCDPGGPYFGTIGQPITFNGTGSVDPDGMIVSYAWTFGDGNTGSGAQPTHSYTAEGNYTVGLCVVDDDGAQTCCQTTAHIAPCGSCPPKQSQIEGEPHCQDGYVDDFNGGCNSTPPVFSSAYCHTLCGETGTYIFDGEQRSDTDWYRVTVGPGSFSYSGIAAGFVLRLSVLTNQCPTVILSTTTSPSCEQSPPLVFNGPGTFVLFVSPDDLIGVPCPSEYVLIISGPGIPACDLTPAENTSWGYIKARYRN